MKRYYILIFALVGLCFMEWGCGGCPDFTDNYKIVEFEKVDLISYQKNIPSDTVRYDTILFSANPILELATSINYNREFQFGAYATPPCDPVPFLANPIDSVKVTTVIRNSVVDISSFIGVVKTTYYSNRNYSYDFIPVNDRSGTSTTLENLFNPFLFGFTSPPSSAIDSPITFQFFDTEGNVFETTTDPIIITP